MIETPGGFKLLFQLDSACTDSPTVVSPLIAAICVVQHFSCDGGSRTRGASTYRQQVEFERKL
jgi:hypothetical protein